MVSLSLFGLNYMTTLIGSQLTGYTPMFVGYDLRHVIAKWSVVCFVSLFSDHNKLIDNSNRRCLGGTRRGEKKRDGTRHGQRDDSTRLLGLERQQVADTAPLTAPDL